MNRTFIAALAASFATASLAASAQDAATQPTTQAVDPNQVVLRVGDEELTAQEFRDLVPPPYQELEPGPDKRRFAEQFADLKLMAAEAQRRGYADNPAVQQQMELQRDQVLARWLVNQLNENVSEEELRQYYEQHKDDYAQIKARHVLIRGEGSPVPNPEGAKELTDAEARAKAEEVRKRIVGGEDFAEVAKAESVDTISAQQGGDLGWFGKGRMVPEFEQAAMSLKEGEISQPVKTPFGYHVIQVQERKAPTFEELKDSLRSQIAPQKLEELTERLHKEQPVEISEEFFGPPLAEQPGAAPHDHGHNH